MPTAIIWCFICLNCPLVSGGIGSHGEGPWFDKVQCEGIRSEFATFNLRTTPCHPKRFTIPACRPT